MIPFGEVGELAEKHRAERRKKEREKRAQRSQEINVKKEDDGTGGSGLVQMDDLENEYDDIRMKHENESAVDLREFVEDAPSGKAKSDSLAGPVQPRAFDAQCQEILFADSVVYADDLPQASSAVPWLAGPNGNVTLSFERLLFVVTYLLCGALTGSRRRSCIFYAASFACSFPPNCETPNKSEL